MDKPGRILWLCSRCRTVNYDGQSGVQTCRCSQPRFIGDDGLHILGCDRCGEIVYHGNYTGCADSEARWNQRHECEPRLWAKLRG